MCIRFGVLLESIIYKNMTKIENKTTAQPIYSCVEICIGSCKIRHSFGSCLQSIHEYPASKGKKCEQKTCEVQWFQLYFKMKNQQIYA